MRAQGAAELVGKKIGELCLAKNISTVSFDRGGNVYHGRVKVLTSLHLALFPSAIRMRQMSERQPVVELLFGCLLTR